MSSSGSRHGMSSQHASRVKRIGHMKEAIFANQFSLGTLEEVASRNYSGASVDNEITRPDCFYIFERLGLSSGKTSVKGGSNYQFHLGQIPELADIESLEVNRVPNPSPMDPDKTKSCFKTDVSELQQNTAIKSISFWDKYLRKGADLLSIDAGDNKWHFFAMIEVINLLTDPDKVNWRFLDTGRIIGDCKMSSGRSRATITFELREEKMSFVLGAHGSSRGLKAFFPWLKDHLKSVEVVKYIV